MGFELALLGGAMLSRERASKRAADAQKKQAEIQARTTEAAAQQQRQQAQQDARAMQMAKEQEMARQQQEKQLLEEIAAKQGGEPEEVEVAIGDEEPGKKKTRQSFYATESQASGLNI